MHKKTLGTLVTAGLIVGATTGLMVGTSAIASASPATHLLDQGATARAADVEHVDYYWNHRHYSHRSWDKAGHRWHYY